MSLSVNSFEPIDLEKFRKTKLAQELRDRTAANEADGAAQLKGDTVTISEEGLALSKEAISASEKQDAKKSEDNSGKEEKAAKKPSKTKAAEDEGNGSYIDKLIEKIQKKIKLAEEAIQKISSSKMPDEIKQVLLGAKTQELSVLNAQLQELMNQKAKAQKGTAVSVDSSLNH